MNLNARFCCVGGKNRTGRVLLQLCITIYRELISTRSPGLILLVSRFWFLRCFKFHVLRVPFNLACKRWRHRSLVLVLVLIRFAIRFAVSFGFGLPQVFFQFCFWFIFPKQSLETKDTMQKHCEIYARVNFFYYFS